MNNKVFIIAGTVALLVVGFFIGSNLYKKNERERLETISKERSVLFEREHSPVLGSDMAKVTLVEFLDPECEACRAFHPFVKNLMEENQGQLRLVVRYAPFHKNSKKAVQILEAARKQNKYWETLDLFFKYQPDWGDHHAPKPELLWGYLDEVGLDVGQVRKDIEDPAIQKLIDQDIEDGKKLGVRRTPSFFVNGKPLENFGYEQLRNLIRSEMMK